MKKLVSIILLLAMIAALFAGCMKENVYDDPAGDVKDISYDDAIDTMNALVSKVHVTTRDLPQIDLDMIDYSNEADALADLDVFPIVVQGHGKLNIEIAAATELSTPPSGDTQNDDWLIDRAEAYNKAHSDINITVRRMTSGEVVSYMRAGIYQPDLFIGSNGAWAMMLEASGFKTITLCDKLLGNTAGILISDKVYDDFIKKYKEVTVKNVVEATLNKDLTFAYTYPYSSSTGLNMLAMILKAFDEENPLSSKAEEKLMEYQRTAPPTAHTTKIMENNALKGLVTAMAMEEQAYILDEKLKDFVYVPVGIRHDHPAVTFDYVSQEKQDAAKDFIDFCLTPESQELGTKKGFNRHDDYKGQDPGLTGSGYLAAQSLWKQNKTGGRPVIALFVADVSGSMQGSSKLKLLQDALLRSAQFVDSDNYLGLVSYSTNVTIELPIKQFDAEQRARFSTAVKNLRADGATAIYDATMVALKLLVEKQKEIPDAMPVMFILTDGHQEGGVNLDRILPTVKKIGIPIYTIAYDITEEDKKPMKKLAETSGEASMTVADEKDVVNVLRSLLNSRT